MYKVAKWSTTFIAVILFLGVSGCGTNVQDILYQTGSSVGRSFYDMLLTEMVNDIADAFDTTADDAADDEDADDDGEDPADDGADDDADDDDGDDGGRSRRSDAVRGQLRGMPRRRRRLRIRTRCHWVVSRRYGRRPGIRNPRGNQPDATTRSRQSRS